MVQQNILNILLVIDVLFSGVDEEVCVIVQVLDEELCIFFVGIDEGGALLLLSIFGNGL